MDGGCHGVGGGASGDDDGVDVALAADGDGVGGATLAVGFEAGGPDDSEGSAVAVTLGADVRVTGAPATEASMRSRSAPPDSGPSAKPTVGSRAVLSIRALVID